MVAQTKSRVVVWDEFTSPKDSAKSHPYLSGTIGCYVVALGPVSGRVRLDLTKVDPAYVKLSPHGKHLTAHGGKQKLVDKIGKKPPAEAFELMCEMRDALEAQMWTTARESGVARGLNDLASAMCVVKHGAEFTEDHLRGMQEIVVSAEKGKIKDWKTNEKVAAALADIEWRRADEIRRATAKAAKDSTVDIDF